MPLGELEPLFDPAGGTTVLAPEVDAPGYWVGAPSMRYEPDRERWVLAYRQRRPRGGYLLFVSYVDPADRRWRVDLLDGDGVDSFDVLDVGTGWDAYQARLSSVVSLDGVQLGLDDGSANVAQDYEERCGLAARLPGPTVADRTCRNGLTALPGRRTGGAELWCYYEMARGDGSHELRCDRVPRDRVERIAESIHAAWGW